jgi:hypothetical protein
MKKLLLIIFILILFLTENVKAQGPQCNCTVTVTDSLLRNYIKGNEVTPQRLQAAFNKPVPAGSVICLKGERIGNIVFSGFVGTSAAPYKFINCGVFSVKHPAVYEKRLSFGIKFANCKYFRITGTGDTGDPSNPYGIRVQGHLNGMQIGDLSTEVEADHVEVFKVGFSGIMAKTDPDCNNSATWRENFTMRNVLVHDNYIHDTETGEGLYIGNSFCMNGKSTCGTVKPHLIENTKIYKNLVRFTGAEGIQVGCSFVGCEIYDNVVEGYGQSPWNGSSQQSNGIQIGEGTGGLCYNNIVRNMLNGNVPDKSATAIMVIGAGDNVVFNNLIIKPKNRGMFIDERVLDPSVIYPGFRIINNTIIYPQLEDGLSFHGMHNVTRNYALNNIIVSSTAKYILNSAGTGEAPLTTSNNIRRKNLKDLKLVDTVNFTDLRLQAGSHAIDSGTDVSSYGVNFDFARVSRPKGNAFDAGAYEYTGAPGPVLTAPVAAAGPDANVVLPASSTTLNASGSSDSDGTIVSYKWEQVGNTPNVATIATPLQSSTTVSNLIQGTYTFKVTVKDNDGLEDTDEMIVNVTSTTPTYTLYINAGGDTYTQAGKTWESDKQTAPHQYYDASLSSLTTGSTSTFSGTNQTSAPNQTLGSYRYTSGSTNRTIRYNVTVPTTNAYYDVTMFFAMKSGDSFASGVRRFNINIEGSPVSSYDIYDSAGFNGDEVKARVLVQGTLDIEFVGIGTAHAQINDIAIVKSSVPPTANAGTDQTVQLPRQSISLNGSASDVDGTVSSYLWQQLTGPNTVTINNATAAGASFSGMRDGVYTFRLTATDNDGNKSYDEVKITVQNGPLNWEYFLNTGGIALTASGKSWEQDLQTAASPYLVPGYSSLTTGSTSTYSGTNNVGIPSSVLGSYRYTSGSGNSTIKYSIPVSLSGGVYDIGLYFAKKTGETIAAGARNFDINIEGASIGSYDIGVNAASAADSIMKRRVINGNLDLILAGIGTAHAQINAITIKRIAFVPEVNLGNDKVVRLPTTTVNLSSIYEDTDGTVTTFAWAQQSGPNQAAIATPTNYATTVSGLAVGTYVFRLTVTDNEGQTAYDEISVAVESETPWSLYINAGGDVYTSNGITWERDLQTNANQYLDNSLPSLTTGGTTSFSGTNDYQNVVPNAVVGSYRYTSGTSNDKIRYKIPVQQPSATYEVNLYFAEKGNDTFGSAARRFDVYINKKWVAMYDVHDFADTQVGNISYRTLVGDTLTIELDGIDGGHAHINALTVVKVGGSTTPPAGQLLLAVDCGGDEFSDVDFIWAKDKQTAPHSSFDMTTGNNLTTGSIASFSNENNTTAPDEVLGSYRYTSGSTNRTIRYNVPVPTSNATYRVNLFFSPKSGESFTANQRKFDISIEGAYKETFDMISANTTVVQIPYDVAVQDNTLTLSLVGVGSGHAQINAFTIEGPIEGNTFGTSFSEAAIVVEPEAQISVYPNPASEYLDISLNGEGLYRVQMFDVATKVVANELTIDGSAQRTHRIDIRSMPDNQIIFVKVTSEKGKSVVYRIVKK